LGFKIKGHLMKNIFLLVTLSVLFFSGCGGGDANSPANTSQTTTETLTWDNNSWDNTTWQ